jgi:hypothetical protein
MVKKGFKIVLVYQKGFKIYNSQDPICRWELPFDFESSNLKISSAESMAEILSHKS